MVKLKWLVIFVFLIVFILGISSIAQSDIEKISVYDYQTGEPFIFINGIVIFEYNIKNANNVSISLPNKNDYMECENNICRYAYDTYGLVEGNYSYTISANNYQITDSFEIKYAQRSEDSIKYRLNRDRNGVWVEYSLQQGKSNYLYNENNQSFVWRTLFPKVVASDDKSYSKMVDMIDYKVYMKDNFNQDYFMKLIKNETEIEHFISGIYYDDVLIPSSLFLNPKIKDKIKGVTTDKYNDMKVTYDFLNSKVKEYFILYSMPTTNSSPSKFKIKGQIKLKNLNIYINGTEVKKDFITSSEIELRDKNGIIQFIFPKPIAYDSENNLVILEYEFYKKSSGYEYYITVPVSFLQTASYPIRIDPTTVIKSKIVTTTIDTYVDSLNPNTNYGASSYLYAWNTSPRLSYIRFDISSINNISNVINASLILTRAQGVYSDVNISVHRSSNITWSETGVTWNNKPSYNSTIISSANGKGSVNQELRLPITKLVNKTSTTLLTLVVRQIDTTTASISYYSSENTLGKPGPYIKLYYSEAAKEGDFLFSFASNAGTQIDGIETNNSHVFCDFKNMTKVYTSSTGTYVKTIPHSYGTQTNSQGMGINSSKIWSVMDGGSNPDMIFVYSNGAYITHWSYTKTIDSPMGADYDNGYLYVLANPTNINATVRKINPNTGANIGSGLLLTGDPGNYFYGGLATIASKYWYVPTVTPATNVVQKFNFTTGIYVSNFSIEAEIPASTGVTGMGVDNEHIYVSTNNRVYVYAGPNILPPSPPDAYFVNITPQPAYTANELNCSAWFADANNDTLQIQFRFYKNNIYVSAWNGTASNIHTNETAWTNVKVPAVNTSIGDNFTCAARAYDGYDWSDWYNSTTITIQGAVTNCSQGCIYVKNISGTTLAIFDRYGNMDIYGYLYYYSTTAPNGGDWQIRNRTGSIFWLDDDNGNLYIRQYIKKRNFAYCNPPQGSWVIRDKTGNCVAYVNKTGGIWLKGNYTELSIKEVPK